MLVLTLTMRELRHWLSIAGMSPQSHCGDEDGRIGCLHDFTTYTHTYIHIYIYIYSIVGMNKNYTFHNFKFHICLRSSGEKK